MDIFQPKGTKKTVAYSLSEANVREVERIAKTLRQPKSRVVDQLVAWGLERYAREKAKRG